MDARIPRLRDKVLAADNRCCFIDRETALRECRASSLALPAHERYLFEFESILAALSTPIDEDDVFAGRFATALWPYHDESFSRTPGGIESEGHITWCWEKIITAGAVSLVEEVEAAAQRHSTFNTRFVAASARRAVAAVEAFAGRWSAALRNRAEKTANQTVKSAFERAAAALEVVPCRPAYDFFSALQGIYFWHMIASGVCGSRDFAFGRMDQYLLEFYRRDLAAGRISRQEAVELLAHFFVKTNELCGTATDDYNASPTPCFASKQYLTLGGRAVDGTVCFNELSRMIVEASRLAALPQPTLNFRIDPEMPEEIWQLAGEAAQLGSLPNFFNDRLIRNTLVANGIAPEDAANFDFTACNRVNLPGKLYNIMSRIDHFNNNTEWFIRALHRVAAPATTDEILAEFKEIARQEMREYAKAVHNLFTDAPAFRLDSLIFDDCRSAARDIYQGGADRYRWQHQMFSGMATIADSLAVIDEMVFRSGRFSYREFLDIVDGNFAGNEALRAEIIRSVPKFGNDDDRVDRFARQAANTLLDAMEEIGNETGFLMFGSFYSLRRHIDFGRELPATPDGRLAGEPISENQSPVYGTDLAGPTAVLRSVAKLPLQRTVCGGLNLKFGCVLSQERAAALVKAYFKMGGLHLGMTMVTRDTLEKARLHPEEYRTLCVRKFGFSEYFVALSPEYQQEIIDRTEYQ